MQITVVNWTKFNGRKDVKEPSWFKFKHKFFEDSEFYDFSHGEKLAWLYILCECSKQNKQGVTTINTQHAHHVAGIDTTTLNSTIKKLQQLKIIERPRVRGRYVDVSHPYARQEEKRLEEKRLEEIRARERTLATQSAPTGSILVELWQKHSGVLPKAIGLNRHEHEKIRDRLKENPDPAYWEGLIKKMASNAYFAGENNLKWKADFLWLIDPGNHTKVATREYNAQIIEEHAAGIDWSRIK